MASIASVPQTEFVKVWNENGGNVKKIAQALGVERFGLSVRASQLRAKGIELVKGQKGRPLGSGDPNKQGASKRRAEKSAAVSELLGAIDADFGGLILETEVNPPVAEIAPPPMDIASDKPTNKRKSKSKTQA